MAHKQQKEYCDSIRKRFPTYFQNKFVVDIGSLDLNGNNQFLFNNCLYLGVDLMPGRNVDICCKGHELSLPDATADVVVSTECFEHDMYYVDTIKNIIRMLKPGGLFLFTCATTGRPEHGTRRSTPSNAPYLAEYGDGWDDYYKNLEEADIKADIDVDSIFEKYEFSNNLHSCDLYFWGIKRGDPVVRRDYSFLIRPAAPAPAAAPPATPAPAAPAPEVNIQTNPTQDASRVTMSRIDDLMGKISNRDVLIGSLKRLLLEREAKITEMTAAIEAKGQ